MIKSVNSVNLAGRRVIVRTGFDVPLQDGKILDDARIQDALPTLKYLIEQQAKIVIVSHLGRPQGWQTDLSLLPVANRLGELAGTKVIFLADDITKLDFSQMSRDLEPGQILMLENLRFYPQEENNDEKFASYLAGFADVFVNEAFSVAHRREVSTSILPRLLPSYAGINFLKELTALNRIIQRPVKPLVCVMGGAKIKDKIQTLRHLGEVADHILVGGGIANSFLKALGYEIGKSKFDSTEIAKEILRQLRDKIVLPIDVLVSDSPEGKASVVKVDKVGPEQMILDIGPESIRLFAHLLKQAKTLVWNGPLGLIEQPQFANGSKALAQIFAARSKGLAYGVIGGGETLELFDRIQGVNFIDHISTGGGAMLEYLAGKKLPAIRSLEHA